MAIEIEKTRLNLWNVLGFASTIAFTAFGWGVTWNSTTSSISNLQANAATLDKRISFAEGKFPIISQHETQLSHVGLSVLENKTAIKSVNDRVDKLSENVNNKLDLIVDKMNKIDKNTEVLATRIDYRK